MKKVAYANETEWREAGRKVIGGSDIGAILGLSPHPNQTAWNVWAKKKELLPDTPQTGPMARGKDQEEAILRMWQRENPGEQRHAINPYERYFDDEVPFLACTPDDLTNSTCIEAKNVHWRLSYMWGDPVQGVDSVPPAYFCQTIFNADLCRKPFGDLARLIGGDDFAVHHFVIEDYREHLRLMRTALIEWGERYLLGDDEPEAMPSKERYEHLKTMWRPTGRLVEPTFEILRWVDVLRNVASMNKEAKREELQAKINLAQLLREGDRCKGDFGTLSWVAPTKGLIDYKAACEKLISPAMLEQFRKPPATPYLRPYWAKGDAEEE